MFEKKDFHIHVPEGATPKDGPSAGIAMVTSIVSAITNIPVKKDVAMTGEVTLRGGIKTAIIPEENEKDLKEIPQNVKDGIKIIPVTHVDEVLKIALTKELSPIDWIETDVLKEQSSSASEQKSQH